jgi:hypothetical protein
MRRLDLRPFACLLISWHVYAPAADAALWSVQRTGKAPSSHVGSAMAVLATLEQAQVLPPEGTPEANRIIQAVIQFQSAFTQGDDPAIRAFASRAVSARYGSSSPALLEEARHMGWTPELLIALAEAESRASPGQLDQLRAGLKRYNMSIEDFSDFLTLVRSASETLERRGVDFAQAYAAHRSTMPGSKPRDRGE